MLAVLGFQKWSPLVVMQDASVQIRESLHARKANLILRFLKDRNFSKFRQNSRALAEMSLLAGGRYCIEIIRYSSEKQIIREIHYNKSFLYFGPFESANCTCH